MDIIKEFFGITTNREVEGFLSWQHILLVTAFLAAAVLSAYLLSRSEKLDKMKVFKKAAVVLILLEVIRAVAQCVIDGSIESLRNFFPLFLSTINIVAALVAAFARGRAQRCAMSYLIIYGPICALGGTYLAANYFANSPVLSFFPIMSVAVHAMIMFCAVYAYLADLWKYSFKNCMQALIVMVIGAGFAVLANLWNANTPYEENYMFLHDPAGTPFSALYILTGDSQFAYSIGVIVVYVISALILTGLLKLLNKKKI